jgi:hypothetical protein
MIPLGQRHHNDLEDRNVYFSDMPPLTPISRATLLEPGGEFTGYAAISHRELNPVAILRKRGTDRIPSDAFVGRPGSGKSFTLKFFMYSWLAQGQKVVVLDPKPGDEFGALAARSGGQIIDIMGGGGFNIFDFNGLGLSSLACSELADHEKSYADLVFGDNFAALVTLYEMEKGSMATGVERSFLMRGLQLALAAKDMDSKDPSTWGRDPVFLKDVYDQLGLTLKLEDPETVRIMLHILEHYATRRGQYFERFNTDRCFDLENDLIVMTFGLTQFSQDEKVRALSRHYALRIAYQAAIRAFLLGDQAVPFRIIIDEASQMLTSGNLVSSVVNMLSVLPAFNVSVHLAFQDMTALGRADRLIAASTRSNNSLQGTIPAYYLFRQEPASARLTVDGLGLTDREAGMLSSLPTGHCLLSFTGDSLRIPLCIKAPECFLEDFDTTPEAQKARLRRAPRLPVD